MKTLLLMACFLMMLHVKAQHRKYMATENALLSADSMINAYHSSNLEDYTRLTYPGVIKYYGGANDFSNFIHRSRFVNHSLQYKKNTSIRLLQMENCSVKEWQCVISLRRDAQIDGRKALVISYLVGQSNDKGRSWKFIDVDFNSIGNLGFIMPDISPALMIPQRQVIFADQSETPAYPVYVQTVADKAPTQQ